MSSDELLLLGYFRKLDKEAQRTLVQQMQAIVEERARLVQHLLRRPIENLPTTSPGKLHEPPAAPYKRKR